MSRRMMMENAKQLNVWEWDYTKGLLQNNGCTIVNQSGTINEVLTGSSLRFTGTGFRMYVPPFQYIKKGTIEVDILFSGVGGHEQNFRICIGNGTSGTQTCYNNGVLRLLDNDAPEKTTVLASVSENTRHRIKIEHNDTTFNLFVDGNKVLSNRANSGTLYISRGSFLCPQAIFRGYVDLFSARIEKIR